MLARSFGVFAATTSAGAIREEVLSPKSDALIWTAFGLACLLASFSHARAFGITLGSVGFGVLASWCFMAALEVLFERS